MGFRLPVDGEWVVRWGGERWRELGGLLDDLARREETPPCALGPYVFGRALEGKGTGRRPTPELLDLALPLLERAYESRSISRMAAVAYAKTLMWTDRAHECLTVYEELDSPGSGWGAADRSRPRVCLRVPQPR